MIVLQAQLLRQTMFFNVINFCILGDNFQVEQDFCLSIAEETNQLYAKWPSLLQKVYEYNNQVLKIRWQDQLDLGGTDLKNLTEGEINLQARIVSLVTRTQT